MIAGFCASGVLGKSYIIFMRYVNIALVWWICAVASVIGLIVALMTVSVQAIRAAVQNQINSLRSE